MIRIASIEHHCKASRNKDPALPVLAAPVANLIITVTYRSESMTSRLNAHICVNSPCERSPQEIFLDYHEIVHSNTAYI